MVSPRLVRALAVVDAPVPPSATARSVIPVMLPPVIDTELLFWVAIVPRPRDVRAVALLSATQALPLPTIKFPSVTASAAIWSRLASHACTFVPMVSPRLVLAVAALVRSDRLLPGWSISSAAAVMNTLAPPDRFNSEPVELSVSARESVVPVAVYVPRPISQSVPSVIV